MSMKISVFITSYNQRDYLVEAIESVLNQTLRPFEIIIVDDCSTDGSQEVIEKYAQTYPDLIRPFYHEQNTGIPRNKSFALEQVRGDLVTYVDGDDRFLPSKLEMELETLMNHPEARIVYSNVYHINPEGRRSHLWYNGDTSPPTGYVFREAFARAFPRGSLFRNELVYYQCLKETGFYDPKFAMYHDWELRIRLTKRFKVVYCPMPLAEYRFHPGGISRSNASRHLDEMRRVYVKNQPLLEDLPETDRVMIERSLSTTFAQFGLQAAREEIKKGNIKHALKYWLESWRYNPKDFDLRLLAEIIHPHRAYTRLVGNKVKSTIDIQPDPVKLQALMTDKIHYGCGRKILKGWFNVDIAHPGDAEIAKNRYRVDLTKKHPFPDNYFKFGFAEDFLEHLDQADSLIFLSECYRTFAKGGVLRLSFPGLQGVLKKHYRSSDYEGASKGKQEAYTMWEHKHFYCFESLELVIKHIGFREIKIVEFGKSDYEELRNLDTRVDQIGLNLIVEITK